MRTTFKNSFSKGFHLIITGKQVVLHGSDFFVRNKIELRDGII